jgi:chorismate mutase/prephenate dehydrogenase
MLNASDLPDHTINLSPIAIIGAQGAMGAWLTVILRDYGLSVLEVERDTDASERERSIRSARVIIFAVPISTTVAVINDSLPLAAPDALLVDVTSLKVQSVAAMMKHSGEVLGLHPMCAPTPHGLAHQPVVACRGRNGNASAYFLQILRDLGARVVEMDAERHDRLMAVVQGLNHFYSITFAHALKSLGVAVKDTLEVASPIYELRMQLIGRILAQSPELYADIELENPYVPEALDAYLSSLQQFKNAIERGSRDECIQFFTEAAQSFGPYRHEALERSNTLLALRHSETTDR